AAVGAAAGNTLVHVPKGALSPGRLLFFKARGSEPRDGSNGGLPVFSVPLRSPRSPGSGVLADADVVFETLVGGVERFPDGHRQVVAGLAIDGDLGVRNAERNPHPEPALSRLGSRGVNGDPALFDPLEEVA